MFDPLSMISGAAAGVALVAAWTDATKLQIPNWVSISLVLFFAVFAVMAHMPLSDIAAHLAVGAIVLVIGMGLFAWGKFGGGDAKLIAAVSLWFGWPMLMPGLFMIAVFGGLLTLAILVLRHFEVATWFEGHGYHSIMLEKGRGVPYGVAIAAGFVFLIFMPV
jgi:prepilin peptidase CpaA